VQHIGMATDNIIEAVGPPTRIGPIRPPQADRRPSFHYLESGFGRIFGGAEFPYTP
jgi:hypothetical protein